MKLLVLINSLFLFVVAHAQIPQYVAEDGLVGWWSLDGDALDGSSNGNHGVIVGAVPTEDRFGNIGAALSFDGDNDRVELVPTFHEERTVSLWFKPESFTVLTQIMFSCDYPALNHGSTSLVISDEMIKATLGFVAPTPCEGPASIGDWFHLTAVRGETTSVVYLNGEVWCTEPNDNVNSTANIVPEISNVGCSRLWDRYFDGDIDEVGIWERALSSDEVQALFDGCFVAIETIAGILNPLNLNEYNYNCTNTPGSEYEWVVAGGVIVEGQGTSSVTILWGEAGIGNLAVTETSDEGCQDTVAIEVSIECAPTASVIEGPIGPEELVEVVYSCDGDMSSTYDWTISNGVITSGQGTNSITVIWASTGLGSISVLETTDADCDGELITLDVVVVLVSSVDELGIAPIIIYPNPSTGMVTIDTREGLLNRPYRLIDPLGQIVMEGRITSTHTVLDTHDDVTGRYVLAIDVQGKQIIQPLLIYHR